MRVNAKDLVLPLGIVIAGLILSVAIYYVRVKHSIEHGGGNPAAVRPISPTDHIIGNPTAPVIVLEYGDIESSYSKSFQRTMEQIMTEYSSGGKVAWVYRHFPLTTEHPNAAAHALAAECAASLSTPNAFFQFIDAIQAAAPDRTQFDPAGYPLILAQLGIDELKFRQCVTKGTYTKRIHDDYDNALEAGAVGSPFIVLLVAGEKPRAVNGALPYPAMKKLIDQSIGKLGT